MSEFEFIRFCKTGSDERLENLPEVLGIRNVSIKEIEKHKVNYILDFLGWWDEEYHFTQEEALKDEKYEKVGFFGYVLHEYISEDIKSILTLLLTGHRHQANALLRRVIEYTLYSVCLDLLSRFGTAKYNLLEIYWFPREWKKLLRGQRLSEREIDRKLDRLYQLNKKENETRQEFRKRFFREGDEADFLVLMYKLICKSCAERMSHLIVEPIEIEDVSSDEDLVEPNFKYPKAPKCEYCQKNVADALVFNVLEMSTLFKILKNLLEDRVVNAISNLEKTYSKLSNYFIHFATEIEPEAEHAEFEINNENVNLWGFDGVTYVLRNLSFILCDYFILLKNKFEIDDTVQHCSARRGGFSSFEI